jgi:hypothetical protein
MGLICKILVQVNEKRHRRVQIAGDRCTIRQSSELLDDCRRTVEDPIGEQVLLLEKPLERLDLLRNLRAIRPWIRVHPPYPLVCLTSQQLSVF